VLRAALLDFNGVLVDDEPLHLDLFRRVLGEEGIELDEERYRRDYLGLDDRGCFGAVLRGAGRAADAGGVARLIARKSIYYQEEIRRGGYPFFPGAVEAVRALGEAGWLLGLVSGALRDEVEGALRQAGVATLFKAIVTAEDVAASKPDPEGYRTALALLNTEPPLPERIVHPHEAVAIEDSPAGLEAAAAAGLATVGVAQTYAAAELSGADRVVGSIAEITPESLRRWLDR